MHPIIIVGSGLAGYTVARELRKLDKNSALVIVSADDGRFYSKPMLSNALASGKSADSLALSDATQMQNQLNAVIHTHTRVSAIDSVAHRITMNGVSLPYSKLVLALGADPIRPQLEGDAVEAVFSVNDLADYARFRVALAAAKRVAIIGGGLIGCEFANDLQASANGLRGLHYRCAQLRGDGHHTPPLGRCVEDRPLIDSLPRHCLQAHRLRGKLNVVTRGNVSGLVAAAMFVFHGVRNATRPELDHIGLAHQSQFVMPERQRPLHPQALGGFHTRLIYLGVHRLTAQSVDVLVKNLLQMNQPALARAIVPVLQGRQRDLFKLGCHLDALAQVHSHGRSRTAHRTLARRGHLLAPLLRGADEAPRSAHPGR